MEHGFLFDCQDMPDDIREIYFSLPECERFGNDVWLEWDWNDFDYYRPSTDDEINRKKIQSWMIERGFSVPKNWKNHTILVKHWW